MGVGIDGDGLGIPLLGEFRVDSSAGQRSEIP